MKVGLQIDAFSWPGGPAAIGPTLARVASDADEAGFDSIWLMDHFFQIRGKGPPEDPMVEGWTALGFMAAHTRNARLGLLVGGIHHRLPAIWIKAATTLDVLSGGRAWLGLGAGWNEQESRALGIPMPSRSERFQQLGEALRMAHAMFAGERGTEEPFEGRHFQATRLLNSPQSISRPRVPIMIGGGGERTTLRLVARYADACNVFGAPDAVRHKYAVLREHCEAVGRPYEEIERSTLQSVNLAFEEPGEIVERVARLGAAGVQHVILSVRDLHDPRRLETIARDVVPHLRDEPAVIGAP